MSQTFYLIACSAQKLPNAAQAKDLYCSDLFKKARGYVESQGAPWAILSARYHVVEPNRVIEPYDLSLSGMRKVDREDWGRRANNYLRPVYLSLTSTEIWDPTFRVCILAGKDYTGALLGTVLSSSYRDRVDLPLAGMGIGQQKAWLVANTPASVGAA